MGKFNFEKYLTKRGYSKEVIRASNPEIIEELRKQGKRVTENQIFCVNFQKELPTGEWNAISVFPNGRMSAASPGQLLFKNVLIPKNYQEASPIIKAIESYETIDQNQTESIVGDESPGPQQEKG